MSGQNSTALPFAIHAPEGVILLHGLCRTSASMRPFAATLAQCGYVVVTPCYPSRKGTVAELSERVIGYALANPRLSGCARVHFVTHSLGGILVRSYFARHREERLGRVVMLGPPNRGSEVVDKIGHWWLFKFVNGPAGCELGTHPDAIPTQLGRVDFPLGVIAGDRSINWINSLMISGANDGKVSVANTRVAGMQDQAVVPVAHPFLMRHRRVMQLTIAFLKHGRFTVAESIDK